MPAVITLDDLTAMITADEDGHRYELSAGGALFVAPLPDNQHAIIATRLMAWLITAGLLLDQIMQVAGIRLPGLDGDGGRIPDLTVWSRPQKPAVWMPVTDLALAIEILSRGSEAIDKVVKVSEYAAAGIPRYWTIARDPANTVTLYQLTADGTYEVSARNPLAWLLRTAVADHLTLDG